MSSGGNEQEHLQQRGDMERPLFHAGKGGNADVVVALKQGSVSEALRLAECQAQTHAAEVQRVQLILKNIEALSTILVAGEKDIDRLSSPVLRSLRYELTALPRAKRFIAFVHSILHCQYVVLSELTMDGTQLSPLWSSDALLDTSVGDDTRGSTFRSGRYSVRLDALCPDRERQKRFEEGDAIAIDASLSFLPSPVDHQLLLPLLYQGELIGALLLAYNRDVNPSIDTASGNDSIPLLDTTLLNVIIHMATLLLWEEREQRERDRYVQAWQMARDEVENLQTLKKNLVTLIDREFRSVFHSIQSASEAIKEQVGSCDLHREFAQDIYNDTRRLLHLIDHMTDIARIEGSTPGLYAAWLNMNTLIADALRQWRPVLSRCHIHVQVRLATALPLLRGERHSLLFVINTLLDRAVSYTPQGNELVVSSRVEEHLVCVSVSCCSAHIPSTLLEHLFVTGSQQSRLDDVSEDASQESVAQPFVVPAFSLYEIATRHGGRLWAESSPAKGFTFHFSVRFV